MSWTTNILKGLFSSKKEEVSWKDKYTFDGNLNSYEENDYRAFVGFMAEQEMWFINQYAIVSLHTPQSQGMVLKSDKEEDYDFFLHFIEFFKLKLLNPKIYYVSITEKKTRESVDQKEETVFVYLKPKQELQQSDSKHNQRYGQISLSLINANQETYSLKIQVNYYSGFQYTDPIHLKELLKFIAE